MVRRGGMARRSAKCPNDDCDGVYRWREPRGIRRFQPKAKRCPVCGEGWR